jgi:hypothetical protein
MSAAFEEATAVLSRSAAAASATLQEQLAGTRAELSALSVARASDVAAAATALAAAERRLQRRGDDAGEALAALASRLEEAERALAGAVGAEVVGQLQLEVAGLRGGLDALRATAQGGRGPGKAYAQ